MSQAINTFPVNRLNPPTGTNAIAERRVRSYRLMDGLIAMIILAAAAICVSVYWRTSSEMKTAVIRHQAAAQKVEDLKIETERLEREVKSLQTDKALIESLARRSLGLVRPGDVVIKVDPGASDARMLDTGTRSRQTSLHRRPTGGM